MAFDKIRGVITRAEDGLLQSILSSFKPDPGTALPGGGILRLGPGDYYGNLVVPEAFTRIEAEGQAIIHGSLLVQNTGFTAKGLTIRGLGQPYAVKFYTPNLVGSPITHCRLEDCRIGPSFAGAGDGPVAVAGVGGHGIWLDGPIVCDYVNCVSGFNPGSNVFIDTTDTAGTNINRFQSCTLNGAGRYGVEVIGGGVGGVHIHGGNIESNGLGAIVATSMNALEMIGIDFENAVTVVDLIALSVCNPVILKGCLFGNLAGTTPRAFSMAACVGVNVDANRFSGWPGGQIGVLDQNCTGLIHPTNLMIDGSDRILAHRGRLYA